MNRSDTLLENIEKAYWIKIKKGKDKTLWDHLKRMWYPSLVKLLKVIEW